MAANFEEGGKLSHLFDEIWAMHQELEDSTEPSNSDTVQVFSVTHFIMRLIRVRRNIASD